MRCIYLCFCMIYSIENSKHDKKGKKVARFYQQILILPTNLLSGFQVPEESWLRAPVESWVQVLEVSWAPAPEES
uniref:Uncharacterized protein n=1 Tax=Anopheles atroparvus TaxID=41427 RepID=A0AAG5DSE3_ANOAO